MQILSKLVETRNIEVANAIKTHFYMDNLMTGHDNVEKAVELQCGIHSVLVSAQFHLQKY